MAAKAKIKVGTELVYTFKNKDFDAKVTKIVGKVAHLRVKITARAPAEHFTAAERKQKFALRTMDL